MVEVAENKGFSKRGNWLVEYEVKGLGGYKDLGYKKIERKIAHYRIYHWGTLVLEIRETQKDYGYGHQYCITDIYGESVSDARGINAALDYFGIGGMRYTYRPVNGGFIGIER